MTNQGMAQKPAVSIYIPATIIPTLSQFTLGNNYYGEHHLIRSRSKNWQLSYFFIGVDLKGYRHELSIGMFEEDGVRTFPQYLQSHFAIPEPVGHYPESFTDPAVGGYSIRYSLLKQLKALSKSISLYVGGTMQWRNYNSRQWQKVLVNRGRYMEEFQVRDPFAMRLSPGIDARLSFSTWGRQFNYAAELNARIYLDFPETLILQQERVQSGGGFKRSIPVMTSPGMRVELGLTLHGIFALYPKKLN